MRLLEDGSRPLALLGAGLAASALAAGAWSAATRRERQQAERLHRTLVELLLNTLTSGDPLTARHSRRVADLTSVLAEQVPLGREEHATLRVAALLHDMGKIDDRFFDIVHSRQALSKQQRAEIEHHPCESAHILAPLEPFHPGITRIVASHHECWNGSGYPEGLAGEEIPLAARIISLADVFDAMTQPRQYREPREIDEVIGELRGDSGSKFDPALVQLLEQPEVRERWIAIAERGRREEGA